MTSVLSRFAALSGVRIALSTISFLTQRCETEMSLREEGEEDAHEVSPSKVWDGLRNLLSSLFNREETWNSEVRACLKCFVCKE